MTEFGEVNKINVMLAIYTDDTDPPLEETQEEKVLKLMALFDTSHDFGKYSICYDTLTSPFRSNTDPSQYTNQRMAFSALSKIAFGIGSDALSKTYGSLRTPAQYYSSALQAKDLENSFMVYAEKYRTGRSDGPDGTIIHRTGVNGVGGFDNDTSYYKEVHSKLSNYKNNINGSDLVPLLVDTQKKIYKYENFTTQFMVPILRESVYDAAPKLKIDDKTGKNVYYETARNDKKTDFYDYSKILQPNGVFVGNIPVSLGPILLDGDKKYNIQVKINGGPDITVIGNAGAKHKNSITVLKREIDKNQKEGCTVIGDSMYGGGDYNPYTDYVASTKNENTERGCKYFNNNNNNFTQKRTGDGNQASICKLVNSGVVEVEVSNNGKNANITKLVLVTIDRMLYAVALMLNIPVIFEHHRTESMKCYIPNPLVNRGGTSIKSNNPNIIQQITNQPSLKSIIEPNNVSNNSLIQHRQQTGGVSPFSLTEYVLDNDEIYDILDTPNYILALTPFIHSDAYSLSNSNFKIFFEKIVAQPYITCSNTVDGITNPARTNFLRNSIGEGDLSMNDLIGKDTNNINDIEIICLKSGDVKLIYKYNVYDVNNRDSTYGDTGRTLYILNKGNVVAHASVFGTNRIRDIFSYTPVSIDDEQTVEIIEDMLEDLNIGSQDGGKSDHNGSSDTLYSVYPESDIKTSKSDIKTLKSDIKTSKSDIKTSNSNKTDLSNYPLLTKYNNYYAVAFNYVKKLDKDINVELSNKFTLFAYLWMFNNYVIRVCIDDEETAIAYDEWTVKGDNRHVLVPTHKSLYLLFNELVTTFKTDNELPFLLTDLEQVLYNENDYMYFQLQQIKDYVLKDDYISVIDINDKSSTSEKNTNYDKIKDLIARMNKKEVGVCDDMNKKENFDDLLKYAIDNMLTRYGMFYMNTDYLNYIGEDKQKSKSGTRSSDGGNITSTSPDSKSTLGGNRLKKSKKQTKRHIIRRNTRKYKKSNNIKKTRKKNKKTKRNSK